MCPSQRHGRILRIGAVCPRLGEGVEGVGRAGKSTWMEHLLAHFGAELPRDSLKQATAVRLGQMVLGSETDQIDLTEFLLDAC